MEVSIWPVHNTCTCLPPKKENILHHKIAQSPFKWLALYHSWCNAGDFLILLLFLHFSLLCFLLVLQTFLYHEREIVHCLVPLGKLLFSIICCQCSIADILGEIVPWVNRDCLKCAIGCLSQNVICWIFIDASFLTTWVPTVKSRIKQCI